MKYSADYVTENELFHFAGRSLPDDEARYRLLTGIILRDRALYRPVQPEDGVPSKAGRPSGQSYTFRTVDGRWDGDLEHENHHRAPDRPLFPNIVCFADIPIDKLALHTGKYGQFGLSFSKAFLARRGARPVTYYPVWEAERFRSLAGATSLAQIEARIREIAEGQVDLSESFRRDFMLQFVAYVKPFDVERSLEDPENFYTEREWRLLGVLNFQFEDLRRVLVPTAFVGRLERDIPGLQGKVHGI